MQSAIRQQRSPIMLKPSSATFLTKESSKICASRLKTFEHRSQICKHILVAQITPSINLHAPSGFLSLPRLHAFCYYLWISAIVLFILCSGIMAIATFFPPVIEKFCPGLPQATRRVLKKEYDIKLENKICKLRNTCILTLLHRRIKFGWKKWLF